MYALTTPEIFQNRQFSILFSPKLLLTEYSIGYIIGTPVAEIIENYKEINRPSLMEANSSTESRR